MDEQQDQPVTRSVGRALITNQSPGRRPGPYPQPLPDHRGPLPGLTEKIGRRADEDR